MIRALPLLVCLALLAACSSSSPQAPPTAAQLKRCLVQGGGQRWGQVPTKPAGFPTGLETVRAVGPEFGHITFYLSHRPVFEQRLAAGFDEIGEYQAQVLYEGRALLLLDQRGPRRDRALALHCAGL